MCSSVQMSLWWVFINDTNFSIEVCLRHFLNYGSLCFSAVSAEPQWSHLLRCETSVVKMKTCNRKCMHSVHIYPYPGTLLVHVLITNRKDADGWVHTCRLWAYLGSIFDYNSCISNCWDTWFPIKHVITCIESVTKLMIKPEHTFQDRV